MDAIRLIMITMTVIWTVTSMMIHKMAAMGMMMKALMMIWKMKMRVTWERMTVMIREVM